MKYRSRNSMVDALKEMHRKQRAFQRLIFGERIDMDKVNRLSDDELFYAVMKIKDAHAFGIYFMNKESGETLTFAWYDELEEAIHDAEDLRRALCAAVDNFSKFFAVQVYQIHDNNKKSFYKWDGGNE